ncbi:MAG: hypothetical protein P4L71_10225 [Acetobacteraceae bacterium]|nr:hypothetical protein [Acetobacteraceae bacterium]
MASYIIASRGDPSAGYEVRVIGDTGGRHTMLGFDTEAEAKAWIAQDRRLNETQDPQQQPAESPL